MIRYVCARTLLAYCYVLLRLFGDLIFDCASQVDVIAVNFGRIEDQLVCIQNVLWLNHDDPLISENRRNVSPPM